MSSQLTEDDYLRLVLKKTCWYTCIHPCRIGALIGTAGTIDADRFNLFGFLLGAAFQIQDDILNLVGDRSLYGKEILGDIWEGKRTLMLVHTLRECTADEREQLGQRLFRCTRAAHGAGRGVGLSSCSSVTAASTSPAPPCGDGPGGAG